jgi:hypothetical protein
MSKVTAVTKLVRALAGKEPYLFNDRRKDGSRSIKVQDWTKHQYNAAQRMLEREGYKAEVRPNCFYNTYSSNFSSKYRLRVWG